MPKNRRWVNTAVIVVVIAGAILFDYESHKSALAPQYWYWAAAILVVGLVAKALMDRFIAKRFPQSKRAETVTEVLSMALIIIPQLLLFSWMYQIPT